MLNPSNCTNKNSNETSGLQESERRFRAFMDNLPGHDYIKYDSDRHIYANKATLAYFGKHIDEFIGLKRNIHQSADTSEGTAC